MRSLPQRRLAPALAGGARLKVDDERLEDTLRDIRNYAYLYEVMLGEEGSPESSDTENLARPGPLAPGEPSDHAGQVAFWRQKYHEALSRVGGLTAVLKKMRGEEGK